MSDDARAVATRGVVAAALELRVASGLCWRRCGEEAEQCSHFFLLRSSWKDGQSRDFPGKAAERHGIVLVWRSMVFGVLHILDGATTDDGAHFT